MFLFYIVVIIVCSLFVILLCLLQSSKKENASGSVLESSSFSQIVGVKETTDILEKLTLTFAFVIFLFSILTYLSLTADRRKKVSVNFTNSDKNNSKDSVLNDKNDN